MLTQPLADYFVKQKIISTHQLLPSLTTGIVAGSVAIIHCASIAALIFSGNLASYTTLGSGLTLFSAVAIGLVITLMTRLPATVAIPHTSIAAVQGLAASQIMMQMADVASPDAIFMTVVGSIAFTALGTGVLFWVLGHFHLGKLIRYIPYPVVGGFLAGSGWLLIPGSLKMMTGLPVEFSQFTAFFQPAIAQFWLPGLLLAGCLLLLLRQYRTPLILPSVVIASIGLFYLLILGSGQSLDTIINQGWLLGSANLQTQWQPLGLVTLRQAHWSVIFAQSGTLASVWLFSIYKLLVNTSGIEFASRKEIDLNGELKAAGWANLFSSLGGGIIGFHSLSLSLLNQKVGVSSRVVGYTAAGLCAMVLLFGLSFLAYIPKFVLGGVLLYLGVSLMVEWSYDAWRKLPRIDYGIVMVILAVIVTVGFLQGVGVGLVIAVIVFVVNSSRMTVTKHILNGANHHSHVRRPANQERLLREQGNQTYIMALHGSIFFGTANKLVEQAQARLIDPERQPMRFLVLDFRLVNSLDASAVLSFITLRRLGESHQFMIAYAHLPTQAAKLLEQGGAWQEQDELCHHFPDLDRALEWCETQILDESRFRRRRFVPLVMQLKKQFVKGEDAKQFMHYLELQKVEEGELLYQEQTDATYVYFVESGQISTFVHCRDRPEQRRQTLGAGTILGEMEFFTRQPYQSTAIADKASRVYRLSYEQLHKMAQETPQTATVFQEFLIGLMSERLTFAYQEIDNLLA